MAPHPHVDQTQQDTPLPISRRGAGWLALRRALWGRWHVAEPLRSRRAALPTGPAGKGWPSAALVSQSNCPRGRYSSRAHARQDGTARRRGDCISSGRRRAHRRRRPPDTRAQRIHSGGLHDEPRARRCGLQAAPHPARLPRNALPHRAAGQTVLQPTTAHSPIRHPDATAPQKSRGQARPRLRHERGRVHAP